VPTTWPVPMRALLAILVRFLIKNIFLIFSTDWETWYGNFMAEQESRTQGFKDDKRGKQRKYFWPSYNMF